MVSSETAPTETPPESAKVETLSTSTEPTYDPFWIAPSVYCPGRDAENPPVCTEAMIQEFSHILGWKVMSVDAHIGHGVYNVVYSLVTEDAAGPDCVARICYNFKDTHEGREFARSMTKIDIAALEFVANQAPNLLVPRVLGYNTDPQNKVNAPFILQSKLHGINLAQTASNPNLWEKFNFHVFVPELATAMVQLFDIVLPAKIGEVVGIGPLPGSPIIGPFTDCEIFSGGGPFSSAKEYFLWRIAATKWKEIYEAVVDVPALLGRLEVLARRLLKRLEDLDPLLLSIRPVHLDPHDRNVLVHDSHFAGLVDWQASFSFMAAEFPPYLRSDGMYEAQYAALNEDRSIRHMNAHIRPGREEAEVLRGSYLAAAAVKSPIYAKALQEGAVLRQLVEWLNFVDWDGDFVWAGLELWETRQTAALDSREGH
ncbi:hypothetical protein GGX14DRAFT_366968 [Mycena pura]|uniref:Aminoglycoside phosphotransferase domain-containing protein n=1 Tax=Mycena pura TaxID=153505 RepID=A0AAD6Y9F4_9AGAR|nr:hypothetical protein GGX14DRAFT_366968 [Mycena pura]